MDENKRTKVTAALLSVMGANAPGKQRTADKVAWLTSLGDMHVTGFALTDNQGLVCLVDKAAVRWMSNDAMRGFMHPSEPGSTKQPEPPVDQGRREQDLAQWREMADLLASALLEMTKFVPDPDCACDSCTLFYAYEGLKNKTEPADKNVGPALP